MNTKLKRLWRSARKPFRIAVGAVLLLVGVVGLLLPILPGWIFIFPGIGLVAAGTRLGDWLRAKALALRARMGRGRSSRPPETPEAGPAPADEAPGPDR